MQGIAWATGDLDVLVRPTPENADRVMQAIQVFGAPLAQHGVTVADFTRPGSVYQMGLPPRRIDILTQVSGVDFDEAWEGRRMVPVGGRPVPFLGREALLKNIERTHAPPRRSTASTPTSAAASRSSSRPDATRALVMCVRADGNLADGHEDREQ